jgi:uncharacterized protein YndB with AHSA1/START domain
MGKEFEVKFEGLLPAAPEQVWAAITTPLTAGWLWRIDYEPRAGGAERGLSSGEGTVTAWEPPARFATRAERPDGWFNQLDYLLEARPSGGTYLDYTHRGVMPEATWDKDEAACRLHTALYYHSLGEYLRHFAGRQALHVTADAPPASAERGSFAAIGSALGIADAAAAGDGVTADLPGAGTTEGTIDYRTPEFLGLRTDDALYRFFGRDAFGWPVGVAAHLFGEDADAGRAERAWSEWLGGVYAARSGAPS